MPSPFPGMDPYLEQPVFWSEFHSRLIVAIADALAPSLLPQYYVGVETRTYFDGTSEGLLVGIPDAIGLSTRGQSAPLQPSPAGTTVATPSQPQTVILPMPVPVKERYLEIRETSSDAVITVIEVLSPSNKRKGEGRTVYEAKRQAILGSASHLVEIDLLRSGPPMAMRLLEPAVTSHYRILVSRSQCRPQADLYGFRLPEPIPQFPLPLKEESEQVLVDLQAIVAGVYDRGGYSVRVDYHQPVSSLSPEEQHWVDEWLRSGS